MPNYFKNNIALKASVLWTGDLTLHWQDHRLPDFEYASHGRVAQPERESCGRGKSFNF